MGLFDGFEKLINEHGSANILKERIALLNDKNVALEQKLAVSEIRVKNLESENEMLRLSLEKAKAEIQNLKKITEKSHSDRLEEVREKILLAVAKNEYATDRQIAQISGFTELIATCHLEELRGKKMVHVQHTMGSDWEGTRGSSNWSVSQPGLSYLVAHGLIA
jgi:predicted HTH transcriptional regulator